MPLEHSPYSPVTVRVKDIYGNVKTDSTNSVYFMSSCPKRILTYSNLTPYRMNVTNKGVKAFSKSNFIFKTVGTFDLAVTNIQWGKVARLSGIQVLSGATASFLSSVSVRTAFAGVPFQIRVTSATDTSGNPLSGTASVQMTNTGLTNTTNPVIVTSGFGSNSQVILTAITNHVVYKVSFSGITNIVRLSNVRPNNTVGALEILSSVSVVTAGKYFNNPVTVRVRDIYGNLKTDSTNAVYFTSSCPNRILTFSNLVPYHMNSTNKGVKAFSKSNFIYNTALIEVRTALVFF